MQDLRLLVTHGIGAEGDWRLHRGEGDELHDVIWDHVAEGTGGIVVAPTFFYADGLRDRNLNVVNVPPVPDGLEDSVGEAEGQNVLDGFLAQVVVDPVNLFFLGDLEELFV